MLGGAGFEAGVIAVSCTPYLFSWGGADLKPAVIAACGTPYLFAWERW